MYTMKVYGFLRKIRIPFLYFKCQDQHTFKEVLIMACFIVPATEAVVSTIATKVMQSKEANKETLVHTSEGNEIETEVKIPFTRKLKWLSSLLWGGSALLAFEHVWHGEVTPWFPFLTAANNPADTAEMLHEMSTVGVTMAILITLVWVGMLFASSAIENRTEKTVTEKQ